MKIQHKIIALSIIFGLLVWVTDAVLDYFIFYEGTFWGLLISDVPKNEVYDRLVILVCFVIFGIIISGIMAKRSRAEEALQESEQKYETLTENSLTGIIIHQDGKLVFVNERFAEMHGYKREELLGKHFLTLVHPDYRELVEQRAAQRLKEEAVPQCYEVKELRKDGEVIWCEIMVTRIQYEGRPAIMGNMIDITERKQADEALWIKDNAIESSINAIALAELGGELNYVNKSFLELWGYENDQEVIGRQAVDFWQMQEKALDVIKSLEDKGSWVGELTAKRKDSSLFDVHLSASILTDKTGKPSHMMASFIDITDRKRAEEALRQSKELFEKTFESQTDAIFILDAEIPPKVTDCNPAATQIFGYAHQEILNRRTSFLHVDEASLKKFQEQLYHMISEQGFFHLTDFRMKRKDGTLFPTEHIVSPLTSEKGERIGWVSVVRDITDRKQAEEQIKASLEEKEVLLREIHHRVKNNMQVITSLLKLQAAQIKEKKYADMFQDSRDRIQSMALVHEKLYQSKDLTSVDFNAYVKSLVSFLFRFREIDTNKIAPRIEVEDVSLSIETAIPCGLLINELVTNSLKYAFPGDKKGELKISLRAIGEDDLELIVSDDGIGIPEDLDFRTTESFGMDLIKILGEDQLDGKIELNRTEGTKFHILFKRQKYKPRI